MNLNGHLREKQVSSYRLIVYIGDEIEEQGTAWFIDTDKVATAYHVVGVKAGMGFLHEGLEDVRYILEVQNQEVSLTPLTFNAIADIALLSLPEVLEGAKVLNLESRNQQASDRSWKGEGYPGFHDGKPFTLSGKIDALRGLYDKDSLQIHVNQGTQVAWGGVSGTPIIDDKSGTVIGLITEMTSDTSAGWGATATAINHLLTQVKSQTDLQSTATNFFRDDLSYLYRNWLNLLEEKDSNSQDGAVSILSDLFLKYPGNDQIKLEDIARQHMDDAWPDLLLTFATAIKGTAPKPLIDDVRSRLIGSQYLAVHVIWHPNNEIATRLKDAVFSKFSRNIDNAAAFGLGIPVFFWKRPNLELLELNQAQHCIVLVLIDDEMVESEAWRITLQSLSSRVPESDLRHCLIPCSLTSAAKNLDEQFHFRTFLNLTSHDDATQQQILLIRVAHRLLNLIRNPRDRDESKAHIFVSHARSDGANLAKELQSSLVNFIAGSVEILVDESHAVSGKKIEHFIESIPNGVVVILQTDVYSSRDWCRKEVLYAKKKGAPLLVVSAIKDGEHRSFPYLGNARTISIANQDGFMADWPAIVIGEALIELLFHSIFLKRAKILEAVELIKRNTPRSSHHPELLSVVLKKNTQAESIRLHPDPPLPDVESEILKVADPAHITHTPTTLIAENFPQNSLKIALSVSDPANLERQGLESLHLHDVWVSLTRHLILSGAQLSYGLDLRAGGYGEIMLNLLEQRADVARYNSKAARSLIAWPLYLKKDKNNDNFSWADLLKVVQREKVELPPLARTVDREKFLSPNSIENQYIWCRSLTHMRLKLITEVDALIATGGKVNNYLGMYPGVVEEILIALQNNIPVFVVGGFGGCANAIAHSLRGLQASELTIDYQMLEPGRREIIEFYNNERKKDAMSGHNEDPIDYEALQGFFAQTGLRGLNNGLSDSQNRRLFVTKSPNEIVWLILKGLTNIKGDPHK